MHRTYEVVPSRRIMVKHLLATMWITVLFPARRLSGTSHKTAWAPSDGGPLLPPVEMNDSPALGNRAHFTAKPAVKERLLWCFSNILRCGPPMTLAAPGLAEPIIAFRFPGGGSVSIEFNDLALDERDARRGAWLEIHTDDPDDLMRRVREGGLEQVEYSATPTFYFTAPGGQVFGVVDGRRGQAEARKP